MNPPVSIIILNYNGKHFLHDCLTSVLQQEYPHFEIIFVDNASNDGSVEFVREFFPSVNILPLKKNIGFAGGNNRGIEQAKHNLIVLLNNDTIVERGWLAGLVEAVNPDDVALASSLILTEGIPQRYYEKNGSVNFLGHNIMRVFEKPNDIFFAGGASLIFKKNIFGLPFNDNYFAYAEDVYLGLRARSMGHQVIHTNESIVHHFGSGTTKKQKNHFIIFLQERNRLLNTFLFFSAATLLKLVPLFICNGIGKILASIFLGKYSLRGCTRAYLWFPLNISQIIAQRKILHKEYRVHENDIIKYMTCKITNGESIVGKLLNSIVKTYFKLVNLRTIEFQNQ